MKTAIVLLGMLLSLTTIDANQSQLKGNQALSDHYTIVDKAMETKALSTLVTAVKAAELVDVLKGDGPFTVFAPTNQAFDNLPDGTLESLLKPENQKQLQSVLTYHVVSGKIMASDLEDGLTVETVQGAEITISLGDNAMVNNANIVQADVKASNGVIHVIDAVILPPGD